MTSTGKSRRTRRLLTASVAGVAALSAAGLAGGASAGTTEPAAPETTAAATETTAAATETTAAATETTAASETTSASETTAATTETTAAATETTGAAVATTAADGEPPAAPDLSAVCPETVVIQTDWNPEAEHGWLYQMIGDDAVIDAGAFTVTGSLMAPGGADTGVDLEIRTGGPAIGYQTVTSQIYADDSILLGYVYTDEAIQNAAQFPTVAIFSGMEKNPQMIMWDPATYPDVEGIADLGDAGVHIRYFTGAAYMDYFTQTGILSPDQVEGGYDGTPAAFVAANGADAQQGFGSAEPYIYENEIAEWGKPVAYDYINDNGWENYGESIATKPENIEEYADCFALLVPILQQSSIDYLGDPAETNALILQAVQEFNNGWVYTEGVANYAVETMINDGLMGNGPNETLGDFDLDRVNNLIEIARPVYASLGQEPPADLAAEDIVTNEFIDQSIGLPAEGETEGTEAEGTGASETTAAASETTGGSETTAASETTALTETTAASETTTAGTAAETTAAPETTAP